MNRVSTMPYNYFLHLFIAKIVFHKNIVIIPGGNLNYQNLKNLFGHPRSPGLYLFYRHSTPLGAAQIISFFYRDAILEGNVIKLRKVVRKSG